MSLMTFLFLCLYRLPTVTWRLRMETKNNLMQKIGEARIRLGDENLKKSGWNPHAKFNYFKLDDFLPAARKICKDVGILPVESFSSDTATMKVYDCDDMSVSISFSCPCEKPNIPGANTTQAIGGMVTYMRRYLWMILLEVTEDDEFDAAQGGSDDAYGNGIERPSSAVRTASPSKAPAQDTRPASTFNPKRIWNEVVMHYGYDKSKPASDPDNADALKAAHELFDPYARSIDELTEEKGNAILQRLANMKQPSSGPEDFIDDSADFGVAG